MRMLFAPGSAKIARRDGSRKLSRSSHASSHFAEVSLRQTSIGEDLIESQLVMSNEDELIKQDEDVKRALKQTTHEETREPCPKTEDKLVLSTHLLLLFGLAAAYY